MSRIELPMLENPKGLERELGILLLNRGSEKISLPLGSVDIDAKVINQMAQVTIRQVFRNSCSEHLEAVYIFPLAAGSAVFSFNMKVGDRVVKGVVKERAEARQQYQQALNDGKRAALMEQERDDVFTVQVGNLPPGEEVTVEICYSERLPFFESGFTELRLPLVVAPRFIPGTELERDSVGDGTEHDTNLVPDASRITPPRLAPGAVSDTILKLKVDILPEDGAEVSDLSCSQHATKTALSQGGLTVSLARADEKLNRDFVLRWAHNLKKVKTSLITYTAADGETFGLLSLMPPKRAGFLGNPRDIVFVLDRSGSMAGVKMSSAARSCAILLNTLGQNDRFAIAAFDDVVEWMPVNGGQFVDADTAGIEKGEKYLRSINTRGGTQMDNALMHALNALTSRTSPDNRLPTIVLLTDGEVGNEAQVLQRVQKQIGDGRLFVVGIDTAVNSGLLKRLANLGGGTAAFVEPGVQLEEALASIGREIGAPLITDIQVENIDLTVDRASLSPSRIPDIFAGRSSVCFFKLKGAKGKLRVTGKLPNGKGFQEEVKAQKADMASIAQLWAKTHITDLEDQYRVAPQQQSNIKKQIVGLAVKHSLLTKFTAFVVVDETEIVNQTGDMRKVVQPVEAPEAWQEAGDQLMAGSAARLKMKSAWGDLDAMPASQPASLARFMQAPSQQQQGQPPSPCPPPSPPANNGGPIPNALPPLPGAKPSAGSQSESGSWNSRPPMNDAWSSNDAAPDQAGNLWGFSDSSGSYGMGVRQQVFEVVVRQAIAGAPWQEICAGPMSVNNILPEEVEAEVARRQALLGGNSSTPMTLKESILQKQTNSLHAMLSEFIETFTHAFDCVLQGIIPDVNALDSICEQLITILASIQTDQEIPELQQFLHSTAKELIDSLKKKSTAAELQEFWKSRQQTFVQLKQRLEYDALCQT